MKTLLLFGLVLATTLGACKKSPARPTFIRSANGSDATADDESNVGDKIKGGATSDTYGGLDCSKDETFRGLRAWRRLANSELINTVSDVFQLAVEKIDPSSLQGDIPKKDIFDTVLTKELYMDDNRLKGYVSFAEGVSAAVDLQKVFPCYAQGQSCIGTQVPILGALAYRRPLTADDTTAFTNLYKGLIADGVLQDAAFRYIIQAVMLSPNFMYRSELGAQNAQGEFELTSWELASSLSYLLTRHPPDATLRDLAAKDGLRSSDALTQQAKRLLADPKAKVALGEFAAEWLEASRIVNTAKTVPQFTDAVKNDLFAEVKNFFVNTFFDTAAGNYQTLMTAPYTYGTASSSFIYGSNPDGSGKIPFMQEQRRGILGQGAYLASHALPDAPNPITRGVFVAERLLCVEFSPPPAVKIPDQQPGLSNKERFRIHSQNPGCSGCHGMIDPLGFASENFDSSGVFRTMDGNEAIAVNSTFALDGKQVTVTSPQMLGTMIAGSNQGPECFARQAFRFGLGRKEYAGRLSLGAAVPAPTSMQSKLDQCQINSITAAMKKNGGQLQSAILSLVGSPAFRLRLIGQIETNGISLTGGEH